MLRHDHIEDFGNPLKNIHFSADRDYGFLQSGTLVSSKHPVVETFADIAQALEKHNTFFLAGEAGSGKSTQIGFLLHDCIAERDKRIYIIQTRIDSAVEIANLAADMSQTKLGDFVGCVTGPYKNAKPDARIIYITNGCMLEVLRSNPYLEDTGAIVVDECSEQRTFSDLIGLYVRKHLPHIPCGFLSSHLGGEILAEKFNVPLAARFSCKTAPQRRDIVFSKVALTPVDKRHVAVLLAEELAQNKEHQGGIIFLAGEASVRICSNTLNRSFMLPSEYQVLAAYSRLPKETLSKCFSSEERKKLIASTNLLEPGVTLKGVTFCIDTGLCKRLSYDHATNSYRLATTTITKSEARNRIGRVGRVQDGIAYLLYTKEEFEAFPDLPNAEIENLPLNSLVLNSLLISDGKIGPELFPMEGITEKWWDEVDKLKTLGLLTAEGTVSILGRHVSQLSDDPRHALMILRGAKLQCAYEMIVYSAIQSYSGYFLEAPKNMRFYVPDSDLLTKVRSFEAAKKANFTEKFCLENGISKEKLNAVMSLVQKTLLRARSMGLPVNKRPGNTINIIATYASVCADQLFVREKGKGKGIFKSVTHGVYGHAAKAGNQRALFAARALHIEDMPSVSLFDTNMLSLQREQECNRATKPTLTKAEAFKHSFFATLAYGVTPPTLLQVEGGALRVFSHLGELSYFLSDEYHGFDPETTVRVALEDFLSIYALTSPMKCHRKMTKCSQELSLLKPVSYLQALGEFAEPGLTIKQEQNELCLHLGGYKSKESTLHDPKLIHSTMYSLAHDLLARIYLSNNQALVVRIDNVLSKNLQEFERYYCRSPIEFHIKSRESRATVQLRSGDQIVLRSDKVDRKTARQTLKLDLLRLIEQTLIDEYQKGTFIPLI